ncbi:hypothetical protein O181_094380 [Austropuccinia psidii MF-1]|uniref:Uncharacterized protein n=1 Tax=Austropuccinia psidii MF-1 TaxID=1389203 RepID=A0A9Q3J3K5_9BASI|nr:hypothetical protein [Austropuccinia psidii MF-1]
MTQFKDERPLPNLEGWIVKLKCTTKVSIYLSSTISLLKSPLLSSFIPLAPIESQGPSNDHSSIGSAFPPNYQNPPYQSLIASSSSNVLKQSYSSSINPSAHGNLQPQYNSINLCHHTHPAISSSFNSNLTFTFLHCCRPHLTK